MDTNTAITWAINLAEAAFPDETEIAPGIVQAYLKGGKDRKDLYHTPKQDVVGGFGIGDIPIIMPWVLQGIAVAAPILNSIVSSGNVDKYLSAVTDILGIIDFTSRKKKVEALPANPYAQLKQIDAILNKELKTLRISQEQRDLIVLRVIRELLRDPNGLEFAQKLGAK